jgi:hypothetical protein
MTNDEFDQAMQAMAFVTEHVNEIPDDALAKLREACEKFLGRAIDRGEEPPQTAEEAWEDSLDADDF